MTELKSNRSNISDVTDILESDTRIAVGSTNKFNDAAYIAAASPSMVLEMIAAIKDMKTEPDAKTSLLQEYRSERKLVKQRDRPAFQLHMKTLKCGDYRVDMAKRIFGDENE